MFNDDLTSVSCLISKGGTPSLQECSLSAALRLVIIILHAVLQTKALCCLALTCNENDCSPTEVEELLSSTKAAIMEIMTDVSLLL